MNPAYVLDAISALGLIVGVWTVRDCDKSCGLYRPSLIAILWLIFSAMWLFCRAVRCFA